MLKVCDDVPPSRSLVGARVILEKLWGAAALGGDTLAKDGTRPDFAAASAWFPREPRPAPMEPTSAAKAAAAAAKIGPVTTAAGVPIVAAAAPDAVVASDIPINAGRI